METKDLKEKDLGQELIQLIRQLIKDEVKQQLGNKIECTAKGKIVGLSEDSYTVYIIESDCTVTGLKNETGRALSIGNYVKVYYTNNNYSNGYIGYKF